MSGRYIDFVPVKKSGQKSINGGKVRCDGQFFNEKSMQAVQQMETIRQVQRTTRIVSGGVASASNASFNTVRRATPKFINTQMVSKQPLSSGMARNLQNVAPELKKEVKVQPKVQPEDELALKKAKSVKLGKRGKKAMEEAGRQDVSAQAGKVSSNYSVPKTPFINQANLPKRPLSKNVYHKPEELTLETPSTDEVTIISKPQKESKVGMVVGIIITIILGAAAGTVAFLLLPK